MFGPNEATSRPAADGPTTRMPIIAICISALAEISPCAGTWLRIVTDCAGPKKLDTQLNAASTRYICQIEGATKSASTNTALMRSLATRVGFSGQRSTKTPDNG